MGAPVAAATGARYAVKAHGSELEYSMRGNPELAALGREALAGAEAIFVGSGHIREVLEDVVGHVDRVHEVPPGVDVEEFAPRSRDDALRRLLAETRADPPNPGNVNERLPDEGNTERLAEFFEREEPTVLFFGKLLYNKGVHVLFEALREVGARAVVVGFGDYRRELERTAPPGTLFTGALEHRHLVNLVPSRRGDGGALDLPGGVRHGCGRSGGRRLAAARRAPLGAGRGRYRPRGVVSRAPSRAGELRDRRRAATWPTSSAGCWPCRLENAPSCRPPRGEPRSSAGAGRPWRTDCWSPFNRLPGWETTTASC